MIATTLKKNNKAPLQKIEIGTTTEEVLIQDNIWSYKGGRVKNNVILQKNSSS